ncbi:MAG: membrane protein insertase YidC, partial [Zoogloeaceae bacterium]|nr:membrane protein insertase YidC [Zoogloeaceae bacterium]
MDNQRLFLFIALSFVALMLWEAWQRDYGTPPPAATTETAAVAEATGTPPADLPEAAPQVPAAQPTAEAAVTRAARVRVVTDVLDLEIDTRGGDLRQADLLHYPVSPKAPDKPVRLLSDVPPDVFMIQSGLRTQTGTEPTHHVVFNAQREEYRLAPGQTELVVPLTWTSPEGVTVTKRYRFQPGSYEIGLEQEVANASGGDWQGYQYRQLQRSEVGRDSSSYFIYTYTGGVIYSPEEKYEKIDFADMAKSDLSRSISDGWAAMI